MSSRSFLFNSIEDNCQRAQSTPKKSTRSIRGYWRTLFVRKLDDVYNELSRRFERCRKEIIDALSVLKPDDQAVELELQFDSVEDELYKKLGERSVIPIFESFAFEIDIEAEKADVDIEIADWKLECNALLEELDGIRIEIRKLITRQKRQNFLAMKNLIDNID